MISRFAHRSFVFLLAGFGFTALVPKGFGYALEGETWPDGTVITMQMELGVPAQPLQDGSQTWNEAAVPAIGYWNADMRDIQLASVLDSSQPISSGDGINTVSFASTIFGESFGKGVLAVTYYRTQGSTFLEADILFNKAETFQSYRGDLQFDSQGNCICDLQRVFLHELGHALGLDHPDTAGQHVQAIMNSVASNLYQPTADDIAGIQFLYGVPAPSPTPTPTPSATPPSISRLVNISTRMNVGTDDEALIGGFIIQGDQLKKVVLRAIGPSLTSSGVTGALQDPRMDLYDSSGTLLESNDNWQDSSSANDIITNGLAPSDPRESAIDTRLAPGNYTAIITGVNSTTGIGLVETYTLDTSATHAANISTRGHVGTGDEVLIGGFIVGGNASKTILVRAIGPSLSGTGLAYLVDPIVELHGSNGEIVAQNDDWASGSQQSEISATGLQPTDPRESALIATIASGSYTAIVTGVAGGTGIGLVEIYDLDQ